MNSPLSIIVSREYLERVKRKSFIITTILMPLFMLGLMVVPALIALVSTPDKQRIAVIDNSGLLAARLQNSSEVSFTVVDSDLDAAKADEQYYGVLEIGRDVVDNPSDVRLYTHGPASMMVEQFISGQLESGIESIRLGRYNIDNLEQILNSVHAKVALSTMRIDKADEETSSGLSYGMGLAMAFILYMIILMYGQMVMTSIIEEKNNRVLEIVVSSVKPSVLMAGKIIGVGLVALTQILIWAAIVLSFTVWAMPAIIGSLSGIYSDFAGVWRCRLCGNAVRVYDTVCGGRLSVLFINICGHWFGCRQHTGCQPAADGGRAAHNHRLCAGAVGNQQPVVGGGLLGLDCALYLSHGDDGPHTFRHTAVGDTGVAGAAICLVGGPDMACRQNLPRRHIHVRQETHLRRTPSLGPL